ncbi:MULTISPECIES: LysR family transcriptional regulator [unclassified Paenibacillus]|uniref:LysR family transcriptional regulator n=1 Tax=unclassified Paenibacillus TaxID=185978 RepID=UPI002406F936|nr:MULTISPECIES: LysR family transcriptional regulator [unclassified Paenibacillus]MDF9843491.1 DNA-binding transcriptional LysR family regulator [Paenibacillus sp. PastF-2]MDF9850079.1 DNA-binding transcriptional LysR family regulator [Paenibacillus sp. PastM-2]MDF9857717.1 DNA-binding transcriptional LysR family regulator [Paenibacillus sp. PastF-1]MDH6482984.1 DNA-binding transcriptional LysR family regulator [Paenibacillus sp. PastH-2]MDH6509213.1 DNA-binding transcriptional LysR family re
MNIDNIEAFVYINHYGSFNKAAEVLYISQPTVTARIQSLERELDCRVFDRLGKQVHLTDKGKQFLPYAQQILQVYQSGKHQLQAKGNIPNELRIGSTVSVSNYLMPQLLHRLKRKYPHITIKLTTASTDLLIDKLKAKEIDLAFIRKVVNPAIQTYPFCEDPISLYVDAGHRLAKSGRATLQDIRSETLVFFECGSLDWMRLHRVFESMEQPPNIEYHVDNLETAKKLVLKQAGICFLPALSVQEEVAAGTLIRVDIAETEGISLRTSLISLNGENAEFIETLLEAAPGKVDNRLIV